MTTVRSTTGSVLDAVSAVSNTVTTSVNVVGDAITMLGVYVDKHRQMQQIKTVLELDSFQNRIVEETVKETIVRRIDIERFLENNPTHRENYQTELNRVKSLLQPKSDNVAELKAA